VVTLKPAPRGVGLAVGEVAKSVLRLAGITDAWGFTSGHTKTTVNYAVAVFDAIRQAGRVKVTGQRETRLAIKSGAEKEFIYAPASQAAPPPEPEGGP
jgi:small subunit ribosomal protein S5